MCKPMPACRRDGGGMLALRIFESKKPVIGAINGAAVGVGVTMTLPMDIRLASTAARFGFVFTRRGIVPEAASSWFLPRVVGISQALEWSFSGRVFDVNEAHVGGLVRSVHRPDQLIERSSRDRHRHRRSFGPGVGGPHAPDDVADARRRSPDASPPCRQPGDPRSGPQRRHSRGRHQLPGQAPSGLHRPCERRIPGCVPQLGRPRVCVKMGKLTAVSNVSVPNDTQPLRNVSRSPSLDPIRKRTQRRIKRRLARRRQP